MEDPRSVGELISLALTQSDEEGLWDTIGILQWRGTREVLDAANRLCGSHCAIERRTGANILAQLGVPERTFPKECLEVLLNMLEGEQVPDVLGSILIALSFHHDAAAIAPAARFRNHPDPAVREAVAFAMGGSQDRVAVDVLMGLMGDSEPQVRDWATFGLGTQNELDIPEIREALARRLSDEDTVTRCEAIVGLARRGDRRMLEPLLQEVAADDVEGLAVEAAELIGDPILYPHLVKLQASWAKLGGNLEDAIAACSPRPAPSRSLEPEPASRFRDSPHSSAPV